MGDVQTRRAPDPVKREVKQIVSRITRIDEEDLQDHLLIREELGIDSLMAMEIIATCEKHLDIRMDEALFADVQTIGDFFILLSRYLGARNA
jgi:acyl carrier protein